MGEDGKAGGNMVGDRGRCADLAHHRPLASRWDMHETPQKPRGNDRDTRPGG